MNSDLGRLRWCEFILHMEWMWILGATGKIAMDWMVVLQNICPNFWNLWILHFFGGKCIFKDRIKNLGMRRSFWIIQMGPQSNDMYLYKTSAEGCFFMLGRHFKQKNHQERAQRDEKRSGTHLTVWEFKQEGRALPYLTSAVKSHVRESSFLLYFVCPHMTAMHT